MRSLVQDKKNIKWLGVDFGARLSGTTAVAWQDGQQVRMAQSLAKQDVDVWLPALVTEQAPEMVFLDAPLSLPPAYRPELPGMDFMYRACDRELMAMSPMFLGGLTARAMQFAHKLAPQGITCVESYPAALARELFGGMPWKKKDKVEEEVLMAFAERLLKDTGLQVAESPKSTHQVDALLAWYSGWRFQHDQHLCFGDQEEGFVIV